MSVSELSSLRSIVDTVYATHAPSGLMRGSPTLFNSKMSSGVSGRRVCADNANETDTANVAMSMRLVIVIPLTRLQTLHHGGHGGRHFPAASISFLSGPAPAVSSRASIAVPPVSWLPFYAAPPREPAVR